MVEKYLTEDGEITEYVVRGGTTVCTLGSHNDVLNMPYSHGVFLKGQPQMNISDSVGSKNIISFGTCSRSVPPPGCTPVINTKWINMSDTNLNIDNEDALLKDAHVFCVFGGRITITHSGQ